MRALCLLLLPLVANAAPLDEALALVRERHPVLVAERAQLAEYARQRDWAAKVTVGWTQRGTDYGGEAGTNAGVNLSIPLFDRKRQLERAKTQAAYAEKRAGIEAAFLGAVQALGKEAEAGRAQARLRDLYRDRLAYRKQQVDEGLQVADALWAEAEAVQKAEQAQAQSEAELQAGLEMVAREYGGDEWKRLQALLAAHVRPN